MEQKNRISVRINGKEKSTVRPQNQSASPRNDREFQWVLPEEAPGPRVVPLKQRKKQSGKRKKSHGQAPKLPLHRKKKHRGHVPRSRKSGRFLPKKQWMSGFSAVVVGVIMGAIVLSIFTDHHPVRSVKTSADQQQTPATQPDASAGSTNIKTAANLDLNLEIVQGGAFSTKANGQTAENNLKTSGFAAVLNQANNSVHMYIGVGMTKSNTEALGNLYKQQNQKVYVKSLPIQVNGGQLNSVDHQFLGELKPVMENLIKGSVKGLTAGQTGVSSSEWSSIEAQMKQLKKDVTADTKPLLAEMETAVKAFGEYRNSPNPTNLWQVQQSLLEAVLSYQNVGK